VRADKVIRNVRAFARKRMGAHEFRPIAETVQEAINILANILPNLPPVTMENRLPAGKILEADHLQLQQVLLNLMRNAAESMFDLPAENRVINIILDRAGGDLTIAVIDHGPQVSAETLAHLFEPFFTTKPEGLGLGLAICKSILEAHSGRLSVHHCVPPPGLIFILYLPEFRHDG
jgi:two-component system sensor histidine kinase TtrS